MSVDSSQPIVVARGLGKTVPDGNATLAILQDIDLAVMPGEAIAILGASGSGKSTLLGLLAGLDTPTAGSVQLDGVDLFALDEDGRAALRGRMVGFVFQSFQLLPALTALENVMLPLELAGTSGAREAATALLGRVGLGARLAHRPKQLSGGEQQRVALARALVHDPLLVLADEPTGNLDEDTGEHILALLDRLTRQAGKNLIIATHSAEAASVADRVLHLRDGKLV